MNRRAKLEKLFIRKIKRTQQEKQNKVNYCKTKQTNKNVTQTNTSHRHDKTNTRQKQWQLRQFNNTVQHKFKFIIINKMIKGE